jgi:hypothetical protein
MDQSEPASLVAESSGVTDSSGRVAAHIHSAIHGGIS